MMRLESLRKKERFKLNLIEGLARRKDKESAIRRNEAEREDEDVVVEKEPGESRPRDACSSSEGIISEDKKFNQSMTCRFYV
jgi:hypothetical protein